MALIKYNNNIRAISRNIFTLVWIFKRFYHFLSILSGREDIRFLFNISGNLFFHNRTLDPQWRR